MHMKSGPPRRGAVRDRSARSQERLEVLSQRRHGAAIQHVFAGLKLDYRMESPRAAKPPGKRGRRDRILYNPSQFARLAPLRTSILRHVRRNRRPLLS